MFGSQKRIFAGKSSLQSEPFCPYITNESGYLSQIHRFNKHNQGIAFSRRSRFFFGDGKHPHN